MKKTDTKKLTLAKETILALATGGDEAGNEVAPIPRQTGASFTCPP